MATPSITIGLQEYGHDVERIANWRSYASVLDFCRNLYCLALIFDIDGGFTITCGEKGIAFFTQHFSIGSRQHRLFRDVLGEPVGKLCLNDESLTISGVRQVNVFRENIDLH